MAGVIVQQQTYVFTTVNVLNTVHTHGQHARAYQPLRDNTAQHGKASRKLMYVKLINTYSSVNTYK